MSERSFTAGARRALARAEELVLSWAHDELLPAHLLWALLLEESEAYELLTAAGLTVDELKLSDIWNGQYPAPVDDTPDAARSAGRNGTSESAPEDGDAADVLANAVASALAGSEAAGHGGPRRPLESRDWQRILLSARDDAAMRKPASEISTLHLLLALIKTPTAVSGLLQQYNVTQDLNGSLPPGTATSEPVAVSFEIDWNADPVDRTATFRILDASANRLREGLRAVEDYARFVLNDPYLSKLLKDCRHELRQALASLDPQALINSRDTADDVGTGIETPEEQRRGTLLDVAAANLKRAQEAARTLEEYVKLLADAAPRTLPDCARRIERVRYELYTIEKVLVTATSSQRELDGRRLYLLATSDLCAGDVVDTVRDAVAGGVDIVQLREKSLPDREVLRLARILRDITREFDALLIINDRPDLAVLCDADGVHVGQDELTVQEVRRIIGPSRLIGVSTHSAEQAREAVRDGASYLGVGPVFPSSTKTFTEFPGLACVQAIAESIGLPWYAIGGITAANLPQVTAAGATRVAVCSSILSARSPGEASRYLAEELRRANRAARSSPSLEQE